MCVHACMRVRVCVCWKDVFTHYLGELSCALLLGEGMKKREV